MCADKFTPEPPKVSPAPVDFATVLWEELAEIKRLRENRAFKTQKDLERRWPAKAAGNEESEAASPVPPADAVFKSARERELVGVSFSGGGIRSATFNLGVLQGIAKLGLLPKIDYLSTVSGGGYIGAWLESWIYRAGGDTDVAKCAGSHRAEPSPILRVQECLNSNRSGKIDHGETKAIRFLREYSNYLTPRLGFLSADTWTGVAIYVRNLLLNQAILILFLTVLLLLPYLAVKAIQILIGLRSHLWQHSDFWKYPAPVLAFALMFWAQFWVARNMTRLAGDYGSREADSPRLDEAKREFPPSAGQTCILAGIALPIVLFAWCMSFWLWHAKLSCSRWDWCIGGIDMFSMPWSLAAGLNVRKTKGETARKGSSETENNATSKSTEEISFWNSTGSIFISIGFSFVSGIVGGLLSWVLAYELLRKWVPSNHESIWNAMSFGPPLILIIFLIVVTLQLGLMGIRAPDPRREWWGRLGGWLLLMSLGWAAAFALSIYSPLAVMWSRRFVKYSSLVWVVSTLTGVLGGKSARTGSIESTNSQSWTDTALSVTPYVFIVGLGVALATALEVVLAKLNGSRNLCKFLAGSVVPPKIAGWIVALDWHATRWFASRVEGTVNATTVQANSSGEYIVAHWQILGCLLHSWVPLIVAASAVFICGVLAWRVDLNQFSMNLFYQNRLVRCYLGASHKKRNANPFTGFDPHDDLELNLLRSKYRYSGPFPIINTALNLVKGQNLAWQERKAESFVITPLRCGFDTWLESLDSNVMTSTIETYGFRPTENYAYRGGYRIGNAISISGAAASPNMGYHSVSSLAFLMTFFNVRLGAWSGNPRHDTAWMRSGPRLGLVQLLAELFGLTDDEAQYVYLSDGGHFENLGLYELVKRRCKYIVVSDADCDGSYAFGDLGNAIRKCREDIGVEITLTTENLTPVKGSEKSDQSKGAGSVGTGASASGSSGEKFSKWHWAIGTIHYDRVDPKAQDGILIYLKTSLTGDEPADVLNYHREHPDFPHQSTAEQWFTESQFESYRRLGEHVILQLFGKTIIGEDNVAKLFEDLKKLSVEKSAHAAESW